MSLPRISARPPGAGQYTPVGAYDRRITFSTPGNVAAGVQKSAAFDSWAAIRGLSGQEFEKAQQIAQKCSHLVTVPYRLGISAAMLIDLEDAGITRTFQIADLEDPDERHIELRMMCFEIGTNAGGAG
jgi:SPP1 family predicted phage head-tail adaptor